MSLVLNESLNHINKEFRNLGVARTYRFTQTGRGYDAVVEVAGDTTVIGNGYANVADVVADLYLNAFEAMSKHAGSLKAQTTNPLPALAVYETIRDLVDVAVEGVEARERDADGLTDRLNVQAGQYAVERGKVIIDQFSDAYRGGDLK